MMDDQDRIVEYLLDRDRALLSFNRSKIEAYCKKYVVTMPENDKAFWVGVCEAVMNLDGASEFEKKRAEKMLNELRAHDDGWAKRFN